MRSDIESSNIFKKMNLNVKLFLLSISMLQSEF